MIDRTPDMLVAVLHVLRVKIRETSFEKTPMTGTTFSHMMHCEGSFHLFSCSIVRYIGLKQQTVTPLTGDPNKMLLEMGGTDSFSMLAPKPSSKRGITADIPDQVRS
jgi:hypothetical protein